MSFKWYNILSQINTFLLNLLNILAVFPPQGCWTVENTLFHDKLSKAPFFVTLHTVVTKRGKAMNGNVVSLYKDNWNFRETRLNTAGRYCSSKCILQTL